MGWIYVAQDRGQWRSLIDTARNHRISKRRKVVL